MRGEKFADPHFPASFSGSSPHAWGKVSDVSALVGYARIIPTCVGKRRSARAGGLRRADHPHMRGEKLIFSP